MSNETFLEKVYDLALSPEDYDSSVRDLHAALAERRVLDEQSLSHLARASRFLDVSNAQGRADSSPFSALLKLRTSVTIITDEGGRILEANDAAQLIYGSEPGGVISGLPFDDRGAERLTNSVRAACSRMLSSSEVSVFRTDTERPVLVAVEPLDGGAAGRLAVVNTNEIAWPEGLDRLLERTFALTAAETRVVRHIVEGEKVAEIAQRRRSSEATVRTQLRSIYQKTNLSNQAEVIRAVLGIVVFFGHDVDSVANRMAEQCPCVHPTDNDRQVMAMSSGHVLDVACFGDPCGAPVLLLHCEMMGDLMSSSSLAVAEEMGLRFVAPARPGFGRSSVHNGNRVTEGSAFAEDLQELCDRLGIDRVPVLSISNGLRFAAAFAQHAPDRVAGITAFRPMMPVSSEHDLEGLSDHHFLIPHVGHLYPSVLPFVVKAGFAFHRLVGDERFLKATFKSSPHDLGVAPAPGRAPHSVRRLETDDGAGSFRFSRGSRFPS